MAVDPYKFERDVVQLYRDLGAEVRHDVSLAGSQIDAVVIETTSSGSSVTRIVECKANSKPVGIQPIRSFALTSRLLRERNIANAATVVSAHGFTKQAREAAAEFDLELLEFADLQARLARSRQDVNRPRPVSSETTRSDTGPTTGPVPYEESTSTAESAPFRVFVATPFNDDYDDVYLLAIRAAAEEAQVSVERADENLESSEIIEFIKTRISECDLTLVDTTEIDPNVYYELGYADGLGKPVILIANQKARLAFDLQGRNHILYRNLRHLREDLTRRLIHAKNNRATTP